MQASQNDPNSQVKTVLTMRIAYLNDLCADQITCDKESKFFPINLSYQSLFWFHCSQIKKKTKPVLLFPHADAGAAALPKVPL